MLRKCQNVKVSDGKISFEELEDFFHCPVCCNAPKSSKRHICLTCRVICHKAESVHQCSNGHIICVACSVKTKTCPMCRVETPLLIKSMPYEKICALKHQETRGGEEGGLSFDQVLDIFQCIRCGFAPTSKPILQCIEGHMTCHKCKTSGMPFCDTFCDYSKKVTLRSLFAEFVLAKIPKSCRYLRQGCEVVITDLNNHEAECEFQSVIAVIPK